MDPRLRRALAGGYVVVTALLGAFVGAVLAPSAHTHLGPLTVSVQVRPSLHPASQLRLAPFGTVRFDTHQAPVAVDASIDTVDVDEAQEVVNSSTALSDLEASAPGRLRGAVLRAAGLTVGSALIGAALLGAVASRTRRGTLEVLAVGAAVVVGVGAGSWATFDQDALAQPRFTGVLSRAPYVVRQTQGLVQQLESYRSGLADLVDSVTALYALGSRLPGTSVGAASGDVTTVLHISDIHDNPLGFDLTSRLVKQFRVDAVVDTGDITTNGTPLEGQQLSRISGLGVPYVFIRGNHDSMAIEDTVAEQKNAVVLDDSVKTVAGLTFAGIGDPRFTPVEGSAAPDRDKAIASSAQLNATIRAYDDVHTTAPVQVALVHDPQSAGPLANAVPLVLAGHLHKREVEHEGNTMVFVEGTTGGALLTSDGLVKAESGQATPLSASLLYFAKSGPDAGRLLAYDEVTVGGLGLTSISIDRTVLRAGSGNPSTFPEPSPTTSDASVSTSNTTTGTTSASP